MQQASTARTMDDRIDARPTSPRSTGRRSVPMIAAFAAVLAFGSLGWGVAAYVQFVELPRVANSHRVAYTLDLVDRFGDSAAHQAYMRLGESMKPWWEQIDELQRQIANTSQEEARATLIAHRDEMLLAFIREHKLEADIDLLVGSFDIFARCIAIEACDEDALRKSVGVDIKRIYRTFRPYMQSVRDSGRPGADDFGHDLEDLYGRFVG